MAVISLFRDLSDKGAFADGFDDTEPIRGELYGLERLEEHARELALEHKQVAKPRRFRKLLPRLEESSGILLDAYLSLTSAIKNGRTISPAAEWFVDNFHIVEVQLREVREDLPRGYYRELPKLVNGEFAGFPRIYAVAISLIAHTDSRLDRETLFRFLTTYQTVAPLTIGELWAMAISFRLALVENLRRLAELITKSLFERDAADVVADELIEIASRRPEMVLPYISGKFEGTREPGRSFVVQLARQLRDQDSTLTPAIEWLGNYLEKRGDSTELAVQTELQAQASAQVTVGNIISSMRLLSTLDWREFFESVSLIDQKLDGDPAGVYSSMNFHTRDRYREAIERIARRTQSDEAAVCTAALEMAEASLKADPDDKVRSHVGYYLIDDGTGNLERSFDFIPGVINRCKRLVLNNPAKIYIGLIGLISILTVVLFLLTAWIHGAGPWILVPFAILSVIPAIDLAISIVNWDLSFLLPPRILPQIDLSSGVGKDAHTIVVIPALLTNENAVSSLLEKLEVDHLANQDPNIIFALLSDFVDSDKEEMPDDEELLDAAAKGIAGLNSKYSKNGKEQFHLFHRRRIWNDGERKWMGWERKRGKLQEFNALARGSRETSFVIATAGPKLLSKVRFVITLDADTRLPRDAAGKLIGIAVHPLNKPRFDPVSGRVVKGYGILQPRISIFLLSAIRSRFSRSFSGNTGFDPYTTASSDVYQDVFGEGIYTGKGLYEIDVFEKALRDRVPENSILSHDLFEGLYARCGLVTDVELIDDFPTHYDSFAMRSHRWVRGDWQIAGWLLPWVRKANGKRVANTLPAISRWKIFDNLRRSLVPISIYLWLIMVWTVVPGNPALWTLFVVATLAFPVYASLTANLIVNQKDIPWTSHVRGLWTHLGSNGVQVFQLVVYLAHLGYLNVDAICRTIYRKLISRRHLLEWKTAAQTEGDNDHSIGSFIRFMAGSVFFALVGFGIVGWYRFDALPAASPFLLLWLVSPIIAYLFSKPVSQNTRSLSPGEVGEMRMIARRTWRFFETFVLAEDNWLPPDNYQEDPFPKVEHRTSPTNIGMFLLASITAHDLGYIGTLELINRLRLTFATLGKLDKFRGHFYNWYDTQTLQALSPRYISTVDSGNLAGHLIAVKQAISALESNQILDYRIMAGIKDTLVILQSETRHLDVARRRTASVSMKQLTGEIEICLDLVDQRPEFQPDIWLTLLWDLQKRAETIADITNALAQEHGQKSFEELNYWSAELVHQVRSFIQDLSTFFSPGLNDRAIFGIVSGPVARAPENGFSSDSSGDIGNYALADLSNVLPNAPEGSAASYSPSHMRNIAIPHPVPTKHSFASADSEIANSMRPISDLISEIHQLSAECDQMVDAMDFSFLLDRDRKVFVIGYNVENEKSDNSFYDLLASEARLASFVAIAKGEVPQEHWFRLGRGLAPVGSGRALISWTATMFEYLMPLLVMNYYSDTLLDQTYRAVVRGQIDYGLKNGVPWGVSESAYNARDLQFNYQYEAFGVPGLGLKRGLSENLVITPYATALAAMISPKDALVNFRALAKEGAGTRYGFYEAIDYTPERLPAGQRLAVIHSYMSHHQAMILASLGNVINGNLLQKRFHSERAIQATELLLQERIPHGIPASHPRAEEVLSSRVIHSISGRVTRLFNTPHLPTPRTQILSNGRYSVMVTSAGSGYSICEKTAVTRWREDATRDHWGSFIYLRDVGQNIVWSAGYHPTRVEPSFYEALLSEDKAVINRVDEDIATRTEVIVSPEDNAEIRRISITNRTSSVREIEVTSYSEIVLAPQAADAAHPAFSNLFIETEYLAEKESLIARRRPRGKDDVPIWAIHTIAVDDHAIGATQFESDRARFLGRGHDATAPIAIMEDRPLSNTAGAVLDPIFSLRRTVRVEPHKTAEICFTTAIANEYEDALRVADKYHGRGIFQREAALAWTKSQVEMRHLGIEPDDAYLFQRLASRILYSDPSLRPVPQVLALNKRTQSDLWPYGISGDTPIVLVRVSVAEDITTVRRLLKAHEYLRMKGLSFDLVILNEHQSGYIQSLQDDLLRTVRTSGESQVIDKNGGVFIKRSDQMPENDRILLHTVARAVIVPERGSIDELLIRRPVDPEVADAPEPGRSSKVFQSPSQPVPDLAFFNGLGGFSKDGTEFVTILGEGQWTPAPWLNVVANDQPFGFQVSETGSGFTWSLNSRENRLTPWSNDAVSDPPGEIIYLRDEDSGSVWSPTPLPIRENEQYVIRHGQGYSQFEHSSHGIEQTLLLFVPLDAPVKISRLTLRNQSTQKRRISVVGYNELVLGTTRDRSAPFITTETDPEKGTVFAQNAYNNEFAGSVVFAAVNTAVSSVSCDRKAFLGRNGTFKMPSAMRRRNLSGRSGAGLDPCAALQTVIELAPNETREIILLLGEAGTKEDAEVLIARFKDPSDVELAYENVRKYWNDTLGAIEIRTPDAAIDLIHNRWLLYQTIACRIWARSAFYQSGGAFGFRDQLQDVMAVVYATPELAREQILTAAARQFTEGDVQHWWHPPTGRGVRTRFSDDLIWLPYVLSFYIRTTGDTPVLDEMVPFLDAAKLDAGVDEAYILPTVSDETGSIFEHCIRAIDRSLAVGRHGLPLMGSGDWNDGMNNVGIEGKGESVWLGWFLMNTLSDFLPYCDRDKHRKQKYKLHIDQLRKALHSDGWDGDWFRRAFFDDGTPLGSSVNAECRIDSIAQSWCVLAGEGHSHDAARAMASVDEYLIRRGDGIVLLFTPPFDKGALQPGYIKGYVPGVRENGGQYTHAAIWTLIAFAMLGDGDRAGELLSLLNPINHSSTRAGLHRYKVEPYVTAGDVYAEPQHVGRGGWTWYTGSASWMYRGALESMLGFKLRGDRLSIEPCIPRGWKGFEITYRLGDTTYLISVENPMSVCRGVAEVRFDGQVIRGGEIRVVRDGKEHNINVVLGADIIT